MSRFTPKIILFLLLLVVSIAAVGESSDALVAHYPFSGTADDGSGNGNHGTVHNALLAADRFDRSDHAYYFNGTDAYIEVLNSPTMILDQNLTISAWIHLSDLSREFKIILRKGRLNAGATDSSYAFYVRSYDELAFYFSGSTGVHETSNLNLNDTDWYHVAATFDPVAQEVKLFVDGSPVYSQFENGIPNEYDYPIGIGQTNDPDQFFEGTIDEIRIYNETLTDQEIYELYRSVIFVDGFESGGLSAW